MNIQYDKEHRIFQLDTGNSCYLIGIADEEGFLGHVYYGPKIADTDLAYLMRTEEHPFLPSGNDRERGSFLDSFPFEFPGNNVGDYRESAVEVKDCRRPVYLPFP